MIPRLRKRAHQEKPKPNKIVAIDPGTNKCGAAIMYLDNHNKIYVHKHQLFTSRGNKSHRCTDIIDQLDTFIKTSSPDLVICEYPFTGGPGWNTGNISILFHFCGMLHETVRHITPIRFVIPSRWKGKTDKDETALRVKLKYNIEATEDEMDAIGIGDWYLTQGFKENWSGNFSVPLKKRKVRKRVIKK